MSALLRRMTAADLPEVFRIALFAIMLVLVSLSLALQKLLF